MVPKALGLQPKGFHQSKKPVPRGTGFLSAPSRSRTYDLMIKSHLLYQLSYRGLAGNSIVIGGGPPDKHRGQRISSGSLPAPDTAHRHHS